MRRHRKEAQKRGQARLAGIASRLLRARPACPLFVLLLLTALRARAGEVLFHDGRREMAMVDSVTADGKLRLLSASGRSRVVAVEDLVSIQFWGRQPRSIHSGTQELHVVTGDRIRGQIIRLENDVLQLDSFAVGPIGVPMSNLHGLLALPVQGAAGRRGEELLSDPEVEPTGFLDSVLDRRSAAYEGVIEELTPNALEFDDEQLMRTTSLKVLYLAGVRQQFYSAYNIPDAQPDYFPIEFGEMEYDPASGDQLEEYIAGVRLADATKKVKPRLPGEVFLRVLTRDGGAINGMLRKIEFGLWKLQPLWDAKRTIPMRIDEIVYAEVLNGRTLYLSQLEPSAVREKTYLAPAQPYRRDRNCKGDAISLGGNHHTWGLGVHADSELTYEIGGRFKRFTAKLGIDDKVGDQGSVVFAVLGDGKALARTPVVRGSEDAPRELSASVAGVKKLTLKVTSAGDMDLGDCANWADAKLIR